MKTRLLSILLLLAMALSILPTAAMAASTAEATWGTSAASQPSSGTFAQAITAVNTGSATYVTIAKDITVDGAAISAASPVVIDVKKTLTTTSAITVAGSADVRITGGGKIIRDASFTDGSVLNISGKLTLDNVTVSGGEVSATATTVNVNAAGSLTINEGAVLCDAVKTTGDGSVMKVSGGTVVMNGGVIENNTGRNYGNIFLDNDASFTLNGGVIRNNKLTLSGDFGGGAIYVRDAVLTMNGGTISGHTNIPTRGGAIYCTSYGTVYLNGGVIDNNTAVKGDAVFYSSEYGKDAALYIGGNPLITNTIYMDDADAVKYPYITSAIKQPLTLQVKAFEEGRVVAEGVSGYILTEADMAKVSLYVHGSATKYYAKLDSTNNRLLMTATDPGYTEYYYVSYHGNGGTGETLDNAAYAAGTTAAIKAGSFERAGYYFAGWNTKADGTGTPYTVGQSVVMNADLVLYAQWEEEEANTTDTISNFAEWQAAFANGGEYRVIADITVTEGVTLASGKTLSIDGEGHVISPMVTGLDEQGLVNDDATYISIIINNGDLTLENMTVYGGRSRCIQNVGDYSKRSMLTLNGVTLERAHSTSSGAALYNSDYGDAVLINCSIRRNASDSNSGGFRNEDGGTLVMENCSIVENRNFSSSNGGGAGENNGTLYMNNCTVANNQSTEIGGGINNCRGTLYILNSTFTGNVSTSGRQSGGGIGNNNGKVYAANSVFAFNYAGGEISDIGIFASSTNVNLYNCTYGVIYDSTVTTVGCTQLADSATPSDVFNGSRVSGNLKSDGTEDTSKTYDRPVVLLLANGTYGVYPKNGSAVLNGGTKTYYSRTGSTVQMAYGDSATALGNLSSAATQVTGYQNGEIRAAGVMGALPASDTVATVYTVVVNAAEGGSVAGGSALGNTYVAGTNLTVTAVPAEGCIFAGWKLGNETTPSSTANPYVISNLNADVTLTPVFSSAAAATFTATVVNGTGSNDYEEGETVTIAANAPATGYKFTGWTTEDGVTFADATAATTTFVMPGKAVTVQANYEPLTFTLTFYTHTGVYATFEMKYGTAITSTPTAPTKTGYTFAGWDKEIPATMPAENLEFTAQWTINRYVITLNTNGGTIHSGNVTEYTYGVGAELPTDVTKNGCFFGGWYDNPDFEGTPITAIAASDMGNKTFYAKWDIDITPLIPLLIKHDIHIADGIIGGIVTTDKSTASVNENVNITVVPSDGYELGLIAVIDENGNTVEVSAIVDGKCSFKMPMKDVTVYAAFTKLSEPVCQLDHTCPMYGYTDLDRTAWYHDGVHFCIEHGLMQGVGDNLFAPNGTTTRAMVVTILWRLEGSPVVNYLMGFEDVAADQWYTEAIRWAASEKIVEGYGDGKFGTNDALTREQMAKIMYSYAEYKGYDVSARASLESFSDASEISSWSVEEMQWAVAVGLINGMGDDTVAPQTDAARCQIAAVFMRLIKKM